MLQRSPLTMNTPHPTAAGILLRRLAGDPALLSVSHVLVDEVHERTLQGGWRGGVCLLLARGRGCLQGEHALFCKSCLPLGYE